MGKDGNPKDDYLQLRKDAMRIPRQFFFKSKALEKKASDNNSNMDNYFSFNQATEEAKDESAGGQNGGDSLS